MTFFIFQKTTQNERTSSTLDATYRYKIYDDRHYYTGKCNISTIGRGINDKFSLENYFCIRHVTFLNSDRQTV